MCLPACLSVCLSVWLSVSNCPAVCLSVCTTVGLCNASLHLGASFTQASVCPHCAGRHPRRLRDRGRVPLRGAPLRGQTDGWTDRQARGHRTRSRRRRRRPRWRRRRFWGLSVRRGRGAGGHPARAAQGHAAGAHGAPGAARPGLSVCLSGWLSAPSLRSSVCSWSVRRCIWLSARVPACLAISSCLFLRLRLRRLCFVFLPSLQASPASLYICFGFDRQPGASSLFLKICLSVCLFICSPEACVTRSPIFAAFYETLDPRP
jgi:hypothetical protein